VVGKEWNPIILMNFPVTSLPCCVSYNAEALGSQHLWLLDMAADSRPADWTCIIHHRTEDLLVKQHTIPDGQAISPVKERAN
jgi:hypothetical protein